ncbi:uncharacterized protein [Montipora foliosa]|uniref:uncharacterized protein n=1 Tax=Montipora foliosa TaxID=591990 RepID=UPI0035F12CBC
MNLGLVLCCLASFIWATKGYDRASHLNPWYADDAKESLEKMEDKAELDSLEDSRNFSLVAPLPPIKHDDKPRYLSYESYPVLCRDAAATILPTGRTSLGTEQRKYICKQTFDCCRKCNHRFYVCLTEEDKSVTYGFCIRGAYKCMCDCIEKRSFDELPFSS